jgi:hypothetical protein
MTLAYRQGYAKGMQQGMRKGERLADARLLDRIARELLKADDLTRLKKLVATGDRARKRKTWVLTARPDGPAGAVNPRRPRRLAPVRYPH